MRGAKASLGLVEGRDELRRRSGGRRTGLALALPLSGPTRPDKAASGSLAPDSYCGGRMSAREGLARKRHPDVLAMCGPLCYCSAAQPLCVPPRKTCSFCEGGVGELHGGGGFLLRRVW